jgi:hypothetical protein
MSTSPNLVNDTLKDGSAQRSPSIISNSSKGSTKSGDLKKCTLSIDRMTSTNSAASIEKHVMQLNGNRIVLLFAFIVVIFRCKIGDCILDVDESRCDL